MPKPISLTSTAAGLALAVLLGTAAARANDSTAEIGLGGLTLTKSDSIRMVSEDLRIAEQRIEVDYVFLNTSAQDIETLVAFPLPDYENVEKYADKQVPDYETELDFKTTIDGKPAPLTLVQTATLKGTDITAQLKALGLPVMPTYERLGKALAGLSKEQRAELVKAGLLEDMNGDHSDPNGYLALWKVSTAVTRRQTFPAGRPVSVSHSYKPYVGGSVGGRFDKSSRKESYFLEAKAKFCMDDQFMAGFDKRAKTGEATNYGEKWISYVLVSGANWSGPIGKFRMVVDKGAPKNMVSFCETGVKKISDTRFEVVHENFVPKRDVDVLIVEFTN